MIAPVRPALESSVSSSRLASLLRPAPDSAVAENLRRGKSPWVDAIHLLWTLWVFLTPLFGTGYTWRWAALTLLTYPVFLALYAGVLLAPRCHAPRYALSMVALGLVPLAWYPSAVSYFIFGCVTLRVSRRSGYGRYLLQLLALNALFVVVGWFAHYPWQALIWIPSMAVIISLVVNFETASHEKDAALQLSQDEVRRLAATAERERIGRDLHDLLGHTLSLITLKLELSRKLADRDPAGSRREVAEAETIARQALAEVRSAVTGIRASDLAAELASARLLLEYQHVHLHYAPPPPMPVAIERALSLVLREAVTNVARHAQARQAWITFEQDGRSLLMQIRDDGRGGVHVDGNGLTGMRERVTALRGTLAMQSAKGEGTCVTVRVTLPAATTPVVAAVAAAAVPGGATP
ncbi:MULTISPECIES: sensor histidine kinase [unclassified Stenotrophomonas]|uniref:sensor histidine kinase n=1 Tax=unclassified Stenotrophomonas TaxID=196198 RepID=UPI002117AE0E|nr:MULTISPECIES: sensor histidine kinase [unclassified Stenotrophomonas]